MSEFEEIKEFNFLWTENYRKLTEEQTERMWVLARKHGGFNWTGRIIELVEKEREINKMLAEALRNWLAFEETSIKRDGPYHAKTIPNLMKDAYEALAKAEEMKI